MKKLKGYQKKYLRGLAHKLKPYVFVGQKGLTESLVKSVSDALEVHELIKVKFLDFKEKAMKEEISSEIEKMAECELAGIIGHIATFYRQNKDPEKRVIIIPMKED
ncbi:MAG: YhbY family RNA-binding protein [Proteobacteria bacterium]|nr:YhbY family RNA-binding protein [Pseudomonadota bacterium]